MPTTDNDICPICQVTPISHVRCSGPTCTYAVASCTRCDREQAVKAFMADHEKDCVHVPRQPAARPRLARAA